ncbi:hypothetical protein ACS0TY_011884 [Phlomoides rotata]
MSLWTLLKWPLYGMFNFIAAHPCSNLIMLDVSHNGQFHCEFSAVDSMHSIIFALAKESEGLNPDGQALVNFRTSIISSDGVLLQCRPEDEDPCGWKGVKCDFKSKRVTALSLSNHKLSGPISFDIGKLQNLQSLYASFDSAFTFLQNLLLMGNYLSGVIPSELGNLSELENVLLQVRFLIGQALVNFRTSIISSDGILLQWRPEDEDPCGWKGVKCDFK